MREFTSWSVSAGSWNGVQVRVHVLLVLASVWAIYLCRPAGETDPGMIGHGALAVLILLASVLLHEVAHVQALLRLGGKIEEIVLGPIGGLESLEIPHEPKRELIVALAGPAANLVVALISGALLAMAGTNPVSMIHPLDPGRLLDGAWTLVALKLVFWINWVIVLLNLLPAAPFDGGRALRCAVLLHWPESGSENASIVVSLLGKAAAIVLAIIACAVYPVSQASVAPPWFVLGTLATFLFFSARQEEDSAARRREWALRNYELPDPGASGDAPIYREDEEELDVIARWREQRQEAKLRRQTELEAEEERRVDEILARLHMGGIESLSPEDRAVLERVSARYRSRQRSS